MNCKSAIAILVSMSCLSGLTVAAEEDQQQSLSTLELARDLGLSDDDTRPAQQLKTQLLGKPLTLGGEFRSRLRSRYDYGLEGRDEDNEIDLTPEIRLEAQWLLTDSLVTYASVHANHEFDLQRSGGGSGRTVNVDLANLWLLKTRLFDTPFALQVGRQRIRERRELWWDDNLDAIRLHYFGSKWSAYAGVGRPVMDAAADADERLAAKGIQYRFATLQWQWAKRQSVEIFALQHADLSASYQIDQVLDSDRLDSKDASLFWLGARARGCLRAPFPRRVCYWGDVAKIDGHETDYDFSDAGQNLSLVDERTREDVSGSAYDVGMNLEFPFWLRPVLTVGRARGSGDRSQSSGRNEDFRQSGLHQNDFKHLGNRRFRGFGEVLRPDLANIRIDTIALGIPVNESMWIETLWHRYQQIHPSEQVAGSSLNLDPNGNNPRLGDAIDFVLSHRPDSGWQFGFTAGVFRAGAAYGRQQGRIAGLVEVDLRYSF